MNEAVEIANDTPYGLATYVQGATVAEARALAPRLRSGRVYVNTMGQHLLAPFGGYKQSGNGREQGEFGLEEYLEVKAIIERKSAMKYARLGRSGLRGVEVRAGLHEFRRPVEGRALLDHPYR